MLPLCNMEAVEDIRTLNGHKVTMWVFVTTAASLLISLKVTDIWQ